MERAQENPRRIAAGLTVVLWHMPGTRISSKLLAALKDRGISNLDATSSFMALATICRFERDARRASALGQGAGPGCAIVMVNPEGLDEPAAVHEAIGRYAPACRCWLYGPAGAPQLRAVTAEDVAGWVKAEAEPKPQVVVMPAAAGGGRRGAAALDGAAGPDYRSSRSGAPILRLAGTEKVEAAKAPADADGAALMATGGPLLTPEELRMLLGEDEPGESGQH